MSHNTELISTEIANLWSSYQNDTMAKCVLRHYIKYCDDIDIRALLESALSLALQHIKNVTEIFNTEGHPIPIGFNDKDVNMDAPRLFLDAFYLQYVLNMGKFGLSLYSLALSMVVREDIVGFYSDCLDETKKLLNDARTLALEKGILQRPPNIPKQKEVDFIQKQSFLTGYFGNRRPLLAVEIGNLHFNAERNALGMAVIVGFSQVSKSTEVRSFFERGRDISRKHLEIFNSILEEDFLNGVPSQAQEVTDSTTPTFSDKLMMFHINTLIASSIGQYGISMATAPRHDLGVTYQRLILEIIRFSNDGANMMIDHGWIEQPPIAVDRKNLAREKD